MGLKPNLDDQTHDGVVAALLADEGVLETDTGDVMVTTTPPLVTVTGVRVADVDDDVVVGVVEAELLDWVVVLLDEREVVVCVEDETAVVEGVVVVVVETELEMGVGDVLVVVGGVDVGGAEMTPLLRENSVRVRQTVPHPRKKACSPGGSGR